MAKKEAEYIKIRRAASRASSSCRPADSSRETVRDSLGLALSGGGIRSATFCLGVIQYLAERGLLREFDILSTVSGGGYTGSFIGKLIQERKDVNVAERDIGDTQSWPIRWLRESGYYLTPGGRADSWVVYALLLRNWLAVQLVIGATLFIPFLFGSGIRRLLWELPTWRSWELGGFSNFSVNHVGFSPWFILVAVSGLLGFAIPALLYWLTQLLAGERERDALQSALTHFAGAGFLVTSFLGLVAVMDTASNWLYYFIENGDDWRLSALAGIYGAAGAGFGVLQSFAGKLAQLVKLADKGQGPPALTTVAKAGGFCWALLLWLALGLAGQCVLFGFKPIPRSDCGFADLVEYHRLALAGACAFAYIASVLVLARFYSGVNLSSLHQYYSTRLCRAYLGASNEERKKNRIPVSQPHPSDDLFWDEYSPHTAGGPLHILCCTLNETVSGKSQIEQIDRKGLAYALGPAGLSVGADHHACWEEKPDAPNQPDEHEKLRRTLNILPIDNQNLFQIFPHRLSPDGKPETLAVENLTLGDWIGISGAAFSTGMGAQTSTGLALLLCLANIRLGYWWNSGIKPRDRKKAGVSGSPTRRPAAPNAPPSPQRSSRFGELLGEAFAWILPAPSSLFDELLAQFHGPSRPRWYLSDGGHFENTGCYELLRRRVGFILCMDCGQDEDYTFEDVANLVRKARIDFDAEITFLDGEDARNARSALPAPFRKLDPGLIGLPEDFESLASGDGRPPATSGPKRALLAEVLYDCSANPQPQEPRPATYILFLKPSLNGDESEDVTQYHTAHQSFPQESTADQFFNESEWESYRALGKHVAEKVLACAPLKTKCERPCGENGSRRVRCLWGAVRDWWENRMHP